MRQLGVRPPEPPPMETDGEKSSEILPHERFAAQPREPVETHRIERNPLDAKPAAPSEEAMPRDADGDPDTAPHPDERLDMEAREPVQVYRIERNPIRVEEPVERPRKTMGTDSRTGRLPQAANHLPAPVPFPEPNAAGRAPVGRWEEFHEFRHSEPKRGSRGLHLEPMPMRQGASSKLLTADLERERRSPSFLAVAAFVIAALLVLGAILWSGILQYRVHQQNAAMSALQERNQKLAETLSQMTGAQMSREQKASGAPDSSADVAQNPAATPPATAPSGGNSQAAVQPEKEQPEKQRPEKQQPEKRQGVAEPPPVQQRGRMSAQKTGSQYRRGVDAGYAPEIVPPYPTNFRPGNVAVNAANSQPVPDAGAYRPPFTPGAQQPPLPVTGSSRPAASANTTPRATVPQASSASRLPTPPPANTTPPAMAPESAMQYSPAGNGEYASPLAQNIEAVEGLQRHSPVQLKEFHARAGASAPATPNVRLSVQNPDQGRGSYVLVVDERGSSHQIRGQVNHPVVFTDTATRREYALVVLNIADQQVYGYVRAAR